MVKCKMDISDFIPEKFVVTASKLPIDAINLNNRARNAILKCGAKNSYDAVKIVFSEFAVLPNIGEKTYNETIACVTNFINNINAGLLDNCSKKATECNSSEFDYSDNLAELLPRILSKIIGKEGGKFTERNAIIIFSYFGIYGHDKKSVKDLAVDYKLTRQSIGQIIEVFIQRTGGVLVTGEINKKKLISERLRKEYSEFMREFTRADRFVSGDAVVSFFNEKFGVSISQGEEELIMRASGFKKIPKYILQNDNSNVEIWCIAEQYENIDAEAFNRMLLLTLKR